MSEKETKTVKDESRPLAGFFLTQYLDPEYWAWSDDEKTVLSQPGVKGILEIIVSRLNKNTVGTEVEVVAGIIHDKDVQKIWDEKQQDYVLDAKRPHVHAYFRLNKRMRLNAIATHVGVEPQYIEAPKKGRFGTENILAYLIHAKDSDKYQYSAGEVETLGTFDYLEYYSKNKLSWEMGRATKSKKNNGVKVDWLVEQVSAGKISKDEIMLTDDYAEIYSRNMREINDAFDFYAERKAYQNIEALKNGEFELTVYFLTGKSGAGKTHAALDFTRKLIAERFDQTGERWRVVQGGSTNPMDNYNGEEILMLDDLRGFAMNASDWLKLLDPINISPVSARYKNKMPASRVIVITSSRDPLEYFYYLKGNASSDRNEAMDQFFRRLTAIIKVIKFENETRKLEISRIHELDEPERHSFHQKDKFGNRVEISTELSFVPDHSIEYDYDEGMNQLVKNVVEANNPDREKGVNAPVRGFTEEEAKRQIKKDLEGFGFNLSE